MIDFSNHNFARVMNYPVPDELKVFNLSEGYDPDYIRSFDWAIGRYNEERRAMYVASQYEGKRNIHMGIDIWTEAGAPVFSVADGLVKYKADNARSGDYGPTIVVEHQVGNDHFYALYGHLSRISLQKMTEGEQFTRGQKLANIGTAEENGGWEPHLHFQLALEDPGMADMPGVVSQEDCADAVQAYPDPRLVLGKLY